MRINELLPTIVRRWASAVRDVLASTVAASVAWLIAQKLFGHPHPVFAAIVAIVCLAPGLPSHAKQAVGLLVGVTIGIVVGEGVLALPEAALPWSIIVGVFFAMMAASSFGLGPPVPIQAGISVILVFALGPSTAGPVRLLDVTIGIVVALCFSQFLLTPDPVNMVARAARKMLQELALGFSKCVDALAKSSRKDAQAAVDRFSASHDSLIELGSSMSWARHAARWSLRGRLMSREVGEIIDRYDRRATRLYASTLLFGEALANALRKSEAPPPAGLIDRTQRVAKLCADLATGNIGAVEPPAALVEPVAPSWRACVDHLAVVEGALQAFATMSEIAPAKASAPGR